MRLSTDKSDAGYSEVSCSSGIIVLLDSQPVTDCITADEEEGFVRAYKKDQHGMGTGGLCLYLSRLWQLPQSFCKMALLWFSDD